MNRMRAIRIGLLALLPGAVGCEEEPVTETPPRQASPSAFQYPEELWDAGEEGRTVLRLYIGAGGAVDTVRVDTASAYPAFDSAATQGARELRFEPARRGAEPVGAWVLLPVEFKLDVEPATPDTAG